MNNFLSSHRKDAATILLQTTEAITLVSTRVSTRALALVFTLVFTLALALTLASCVNDIGEESGTGALPVATARIITRTNAEDVPPVYPVHIYAFNAAGKCAATQVINSAQDDIRLPLPAGTFTIYALGGATATRYNLPDSATVTPTTVIEPKTNNGLHDELQADHATITLEEGETQNLTLTMERVITGITATVTNVPQEVTAVTIALQPLAPALQLNGECTEGDPVKVTIPLSGSEALHPSSRGSEALHPGSRAASGGGTWSTTTRQYILPATEETTITIALTTSEGTQSYAYSSGITPAAGYKVEIEATYTKGAPQLQGTLTGTDWKGTQNISINFSDAAGEAPGPGSDAGGDNTGGTGSDAGGDNTGTTPQVGDIYRGCYVLAVTTTGTDTQITLLASQQTIITGTSGNTTTSQITAYLADYTETGINNQNGDGTSIWQLPTTDMATNIYTNFTTINAALNAAAKTEMAAAASYTFVDDSQTLRVFGKEADPTSSPRKVSDTSGPYAVRPVATISL